MQQPRKHYRRRAQASSRRIVIAIILLLLFIAGVTLIGWLHHPVFAVRIFACGLIVVGLLRIALRNQKNWLRARIWWADAIFLIGTGIVMLFLARYAGVIMPTPPLF